MNNIQEIRAAIIKNALKNGSDDCFQHNLELLRVLFKLEVIGRATSWNYTDGVFSYVYTMPVKRAGV